jgi:diguanylate cyclase (GGDEF)-like protein
MENADLKILIVDDDEGDRKEVKRALKLLKPGCECVEAVSITEALARLTETSFDAIMLDLGLGDVKGLDGVRAVIEQYPDIPVVILSAHNDDETALSAVRHGAQEYLVKGHSGSRAIGLAVLSSIERKNYERRLFKQANHDELTGLANRRMFFDHMKQALLQASRWKCIEAIIFMDVQGFKSVNDTYGHDIGDELLVEISVRLRGALRSGDMLARYAGDEFIVHLDTNTHCSRQTCTIVAQRIADAFLEPITIGGHAVKAGVSVGIAFYPDNGKDTAELIQSADAAMYEHKRSGKGACAFAVTK